MGVPAEASSAVVVPETMLSALVTPCPLLPVVVPWRWLR